ncbi:MAG: phosphate transporter substrate-binding protein [Solirubrobacterales bacterium]|nr:phosphate transporter substrate-binding protein [Solirubrobacterales bacterium]
MNRARRLGVGACAVAVLGAAVPATASAVPVVTMSGSTSVAPLASLLAKGYLTDKKLKGKLKFKLAQGGSDVGVADAAAGRVSIGNSSRDPKDSDTGVVFNKIAKDAICLITNPNNKVANLTKAQIVSIFSGKVRNWEDVGGAGVTGPINLTVRTAASGTQDAFSKIFMGSTAVSTNASAKASNGLVQQAVQADKNAIGYVSADFTKGVNSAGYEGVGCSLANAKSGQYGGVRSFYMVTRGAPRGSTAKFISWVQNAPAAQKIIGTHWVPLK